MTADAIPNVGPPRVVGLALRAWVLAAIRAGLSILGALAAVLAGASADAAYLGWAAGAVLVSIILAGDRRGRLSMPPQPLPSGAIPESWSEIARTDVFPSTVGVAALTVVALAFNAALAALLAGILGGMAFMTVVSGIQVAISERKFGGRLSFERATRRLYVAAHR